MTAADIDNLTQVFTAYDFHAIPSKGEVRAQLLAIADLLFVQKPAPIYRLISQGIPEEYIPTFWSQLSIDDISMLLKAQKPTPRRVSAPITTGELDLNDNRTEWFIFWGSTSLVCGQKSCRTFYSSALDQSTCHLMGSRCASTKTLVLWALADWFKVTPPPSDCSICITHRE